ncbi:hypothetical protein BDW22DRAFT_1347928 [Trametopsis cervina]|nr:hypothetical protein BDW22DRAFT_1347928 [Trametopsis cervina]
MADAAHLSANFRLTAMDLARRLSFLQHYVSAAHELVLRFEQLQPRELRRHTRKIVALIEISRQTLLRCGLRLYHFAACPPALSQHKCRFFDLLRTLKQQRRFMDNSEHELRGRIDRLLLPLSSNLRIASTEDTAAHPSYYSKSVGLVSPPPSPVSLPSTSRSGYTAVNTVSRGYASSDTEGKMLPPDVLMSRSSKRRIHRIQQPVQVGGNVFGRAPETRQHNEPSAAATDAPPEDVEAESSHLPRLVAPSRRRFGIFCTSKAGHRRSGSMR